MANNSSIEWTDATWNPVTGCTKISSGCKNCYAERFAERFRGVMGHPYEQGFDLTLWPARLQLPLTWRRSRMVFVNSMSDLFHEDVPDEFIQSVFDVMEQATHHTFQFLTKRSVRLVQWTEARYSLDKARERRLWPRNVWAGVSVEDQSQTSRIGDLRNVPAFTRFLSVEPLLGPVRLSNQQLRSLHWVIVGGESGPGARPMNPKWVRDVRDACQATGVAFFFKQWGAHDARGRRVGKKAAGRRLDGRTWDAMPAVGVGPPSA
ncbi:MAG: phage Gp37/Gp68 family protein [Acidobacteria bacterium]|nr:phage Gp37/Gp68 family protein [Acidobacteriota bacterium]